MQYINLTSDEVVLNDGRVFPPSGELAKINLIFTDVVDDICIQQYSEVINLPEQQGGQRLIVSPTVLAALHGSREDVVSPAIHHPKVIKNELGQILSVPCFIQ